MRGGRRRPSSPWPGSTPEQRSPAVDRAIAASVDFLLSRDPAVADYPMGWGRHEGRTAPGSGYGFPSGYVTDVLQVLEALVEAGAGGDPRLAAAVEWLLGQQDDQGRWANRYPYTGKMWIDIDRPGAPRRPAGSPWPAPVACCAPSARPTAAPPAAPPHPPAPPVRPSAWPPLPPPGRARHSPDPVPGTSAPFVPVDHLAGGLRLPANRNGPGGSRGRAVGSAFAPGARRAGGRSSRCSRRACRSSGGRAPGRPYRRRSRWP